MSSALPVIAAAKGAPAALQLDPRTYARGLSCVHCGLCLPACPTYTENGLEADSPRGRIQLMLGMHEGKIEASEKVRHHLDLCLDCRACETACPSSVQYHELIEETRAKLPPAKQSIGDRLVRFMFLHILTRPWRLKLALLPARLSQKIGIYGVLRRIGLFRVLPRGLRKMEQMLPDAGPLWPRRPAVIHPPLAYVAGRGWQLAGASLEETVGLLSQTEHAEKLDPREGVLVAFFTGCVGSVMFSEVNRKAIELLTAAGCTVHVAPGEACCGAMHHHNGLHQPAERMARKNIDVLSGFAGAAGADALLANPKFFIVSTVAGCGAMLRDYGMLLRDDAAYAKRAAAFAARVRDVTELLAELPLPPMSHPVQMTVTYHDACHLAHAQKVAAQPRAVLAKVPGLKLVPLPESDMCCGAAGTYNLTHPEMATALAERKLRHIAATGAQACVAGNVGCAMHIESAARGSQRELRVLHPVEILHQAVFGK
jgi:glycolate oxidase iron-sulfur subunit